MISVSRSVSRPVSRSVLSGQSNDLASIIKKLFSNGEQGFFYDPNDLSTMFQDATGTIPVTGVGQPVGLIRDKSGRNNHAYQTTSASRPILRQNAVTGAYYLEFDGVDDYFETSAFACPAPYATIHGALFTKTTLGTQAILSAVSAGYLYTSFRAEVPNIVNATQQLTSNPQLLVQRDQADVVLMESNGTTVHIKTNQTSGRSDSIVAKEPFGTNAKKYIGTYSPSLAAHAGMNYYGGLLIAKSLSAGDEVDIRTLFNKRMGI